MTPSLATQLYACLIVLTAVATVVFIFAANARKIAGEAASRDLPVTETAAEVLRVDRSNIWHAAVTFQLADGPVRTFETEWHPRYDRGASGPLRFRGVHLEQFTPRTDA